MLKQRIITAVVLVSVLLLALFANNPVFWRGVITFAVLVAFYEWLRFCEITDLMQKTLAYAAFAAMSFALQAGYLGFALVIPVMCVVWCVILLFTLTDSLLILHNRFIKLLIGLTTLTSACWLLIEFKRLESGALWVICFLVAVCAADVGAYFVGKKFGKTKLAPSISPGKTVEGFLGGLALVLLIFVPVLFSVFTPAKAALLLITVMVTAVVSVGGDLFESKLKRHVGLKDSSQILPGHGGVLDRVDSLMAGAPMFAMGLLWLGYFSA